MIPHLYVDVTDCIDEKVASLACHASQKQWLDESQGMDSYLETMKEASREVGECRAAMSTQKVGEGDNIGASVGPMMTRWPKPCWAAVPSDLEAC